MSCLIWFTEVDFGVYGVSKGVGRGGWCGGGGGGAIQDD